MRADDWCPVRLVEVDAVADLPGELPREIARFIRAACVLAPIAPRRTRRRVALARWRSCRGDFVLTLSRHSHVGRDASTSTAEPRVPTWPYFAVQSGLARDAARQRSVILTDS